MFWPSKKKDRMCHFKEPSWPFVLMNTCWVPNSIPKPMPSGMSMYLQRADKKKTVIEGYGEEKWKSMIHQLNDPDKIRKTYSQVIPNFLNIARGRR